MLLCDKFRFCSVAHFATFSASIYRTTIGFAIAWTNPVLPLLFSTESPFGRTITMEEASYITSLVYLGCVVGTTVIGFMFDKLGRKRSLIISAIPTFISWILILCTKSIIILYISRFVMGLTAALTVSGTTLYVSEISEPKERGILCFMLFLAQEVGCLIVVIIGSYVSYDVLAGASSSASVIFLATFIFMPESPYYYLRKGDTDAAYKALESLRGTSDINEEFKELMDSVKKDMENKSGVWQIMTRKEYRKELLTVIGLMALLYLCGSLVIQSYMEIIFHQASTGLSSHISTIICSVIPVVVMFLSSFAVDGVGRKPLFYVSIVGSFVGLMLEFIYFYLQDTVKLNMESLHWFPLTGIIIFFLFRSIGMSTLPFIYLGELFPSNIRGQAISICSFVGTLLSFTVILIFPHVVLHIGICYVFLIFATVCFLGFIFVYFFVPETKGKSLQAIQQDFVMNESTRL